MESQLENRMVSNTDIRETMTSTSKEIYMSDHFEQGPEFLLRTSRINLQEWYRNGIVDENTNLYVWTGIKKYASENFQKIS